MQPKPVVARLVATHHGRSHSQRPGRPLAHPINERQQAGMIAALQPMVRYLVPVWAVHRHQPTPLAQFDRNENRATIARGGRVHRGCLHLSLRWFECWKPKPIGKATLTAPWNLRAALPISRSGGDAQEGQLASIPQLDAKS